MNVFLIFATVAFLVPFLINLFLTPVIIHVSHKHQIFDEKDHRKTHDGDISRLGGIGIFLSFLIGLCVVFIMAESYMDSLIPVFIRAAGFVILFAFSFLLGFVDDLMTMRARHKLLVQIAITVLACAFGLTITQIAVPFTSTIWHLVPPLAWLLSIGWMIGATNALNLMDGMDGLAGGIADLAGVALGLIALSSGQYVTALLCFIMVGSTMGYLFYNFPPARIFMGDGGSYQLGFFVAVVPFMGLTPHPALNFSIVVTLMMIPILDTFSAMIRRAAAGRHIFAPDRGHLHHKLQDWGLSRRRILAAVYSCMILLGSVCFYHAWRPGVVSWSLITLVWLAGIGTFTWISRHHRKHVSRLSLVNTKAINKEELA